MTRSLCYAAYGSNLHPVRLRERTPSARLLGTARLADHALVFVKRGRDGSGKCTLVETPGAEAYVAVYEMDEGDKAALDRAEGVGRGYDLATLDLPPFGGCETYLAQAAYVDATLRPFTWYRELVRIGCEFHRFPDAYVRQVAAVEALPDPDPARHQRRMLLVRRALAGTL